MLILSAASFPTVPTKISTFPCDPQNSPDTIFLRFFHPDCRIQLPPSRLICGVRMPASQELPEVSEDILALPLPRMPEGSITLQVS